MRVRNRFSERVAVVLDTSVEPDRAKQSFKDSSDINFIMARYARGGTIDHLAKHGARYGDFSPMTFQESMNIVRKAEEMFDDLPAKVRKRFQNSPVAFLEFIQAVDGEGKPKHLEEMRELGLALPEKAPEPLSRVELGSESLEALRAPAPASPA